MKFIESTERNVRQCDPLFGYSRYISSPALAIEVLKNRMWQNTKQCVNLVGVLFNSATVRSISTSSICSAARSSAVQPGYVSEDKILQIKHHQNDYAQQYPSVTLILNKTMTDDSRNALEKWKQERIAEMGEEEFNKFYQGMLLVCNFILLHLNMISSCFKYLC